MLIVKGMRLMVFGFDCDTNFVKDVGSKVYETNVDTSNFLDPSSQWTRALET